MPARPADFIYPWLYLTKIVSKAAGQCNWPAVRCCVTRDRLLAKLSITWFLNLRYALYDEARLWTKS